MTRVSKECSFCRKENFIADTRYFYDNENGIYLHACYDCLTLLVFKEWENREKKTELREWKAAVTRRDRR